LTLFFYPLAGTLLVAGSLLLQFAALWIVYGAWRDGTLADFLGLGWLSKGFKLFELGLPSGFAALSYWLLPPVKIIINRHERNVAVKKLLPFSYQRKFGVDFIKNGIVSTGGKMEIPQTADLFFELNSGEKVQLSSGAAVSRKSAREISEQVNRFLGS
jgi:hypothetical protein